jgi:hypothetical protein
MIFETVRGRIGAAMFRQRPVLRSALDARPTASQGEAPVSPLPKHGIPGKVEERRNSGMREGECKPDFPGSEATFTQKS